MRADVGGRLVEPHTDRVGRLGLRVGDLLLGGVLGQLEQDVREADRADRFTAALERIVASYCRATSSLVRAISTIADIYELSTSPKARSRLMKSEQ